jgi:serine/threonine-protein kinase
VKLALTREARALALMAVKRGLLDPDVLWDMACRWTLGGAGSPRELLATVLSSEQIAELEAESIPKSVDRSETISTSVEARANFETLTYGAPRTERTPALSAVSEPRYELGDALGAGGVGKVVRARDRDIGRVVALKTLKLGPDAQPSVAARFLSEARVTAQLEHPNVVPVYDLGTLPDGQPYYTMRVVKRQSLQDVMGNAELRKQWPLVRLVGAFVQVSRALAYAHRRGVLHRDIKPENILLGDFGEIYLADWGNAKTIGSDEVVDPIRPDDPRLTENTPQSGLSGTPGYMAPEQIRGDKGKIDHRADIFALGVVLYEMLTGEHPFDAPTVLTVIVATQSREPRPPRSIVPGCPLVLEDLCLAMLSKDPGKRPESADRVAAEVEAFLEGAKEKARRREEAKKLCELAKVPVDRDRALDDERERLVDEARRMLQDVKGFESIDKKRPGWELEDRAASVEREQARAMAEAIDLYTKALAYDPELVEARSGLADLYWSRAVRADEERRPAQRVYYEALVSEFDVGKYAALLKADAALSINSNPSGAAVLAYRYVEKDRILVASDERYLGRTPLREARLNPGSYLIIVKRAGFRDVRYPVFLRRGAHHQGDVTLYTDAEIGEDFIYIPGGPFVAGGDMAAYDPLKRVEVDVPDFAIAKVPVTFGEYCKFLDHLERVDPTLARKRAPHDGTGPAARVSADGRWEPMPFVEGEAAKTFPAEEGHLWNLPVLNIDWFDALAYCRWRGERDSIDVRLPLEIEWEKAARGADGRFYPWGDHFDPTFCQMRFSRAWHPQPEPVGTFPTDVSPYGVRDMAGGMREWVGDVHGERTWEELSREAEMPPDSSRASSSWRIFRSGNWAASEENRCRSASRTRFFALARVSNLSFRIARSLSRGARRP